MNDTHNLLQVHLPVGRLVQGSLYDLSTLGDQKAGITRTPQYFIAIAIPKGAETHWRETVWGTKIWAYAQAAFPNQEFLSPRFSWKISDGDDTAPNQRGTIPCQQPGFKNCWIIRSSSVLPTKVLTPDGSRVLPDAGVVKRGDYLECILTVNRNRPPKTGESSMYVAGLYLYISHAAFSARGEEIAYLPSVDLSSVKFGAQPLPAGASPVTAAELSQVSVSFGGQPANTAAMPPLPAPHRDILTPSMPTKTRTMSPRAVMSYQEYIDSGLTEQMLIDAGLLIIS